MNKNLLTLKEYLEPQKPFLIPNYQRGYIWGKGRGTEKNSIEYLLESILNGFHNNVELFLQGVTVCDDTDENIEIIDGQQRTTAFYILLQYLNYSDPFELKYTIRTASQDFLDKLKSEDHASLLDLCSENVEEEFQDIYYFKKSYRAIHERLTDFDAAKRDALKSYLLEKIQFLYIKIPKDKAMLVFSMMNGNKAEMLTEEIIKAEMLRLAALDSQPDSNTTIKWETNQLRSRYAREWDKWLHWWNKPEVQAFYHTTNVMGLLVKSYFYGNNDVKLSDDFNFDNFRDRILRGENNSLIAKDTFYDLRNLQKKFEDTFNSIKDSTHNNIGAIYTLHKKEGRDLFTRDYFSKNISTKINIDCYVKYLYLGLPHSTIIDLISKNPSPESREELDAKKNVLREALEDNNLYNSDNKELAFRELLRLNVAEDTKLERSFKFNIWKERSLEHIYPKSKVAELGGDGDLIHSLGNLVLLYKNENSSFGAGEFWEKKQKYFNLDSEKPFLSRHLIHTISAFAKEKWGIEEIKDHKTKTITEIKKYYGIQ